MDDELEHDDEEQIDNDDELGSEQLQDDFDDVIEEERGKKGTAKKDSLKRDGRKKYERGTLDKDVNED